MKKEEYLVVVAMVVLYAGMAVLVALIGGL